MAKPKVIIRRAPEYDPVAIEKIIGEGLGELGLDGRDRQVSRGYRCQEAIARRDMHKNRREGPGLT